MPPVKQPKKVSSNPQLPQLEVPLADGAISNPKIKPPKLTNRGGAGLYGKIKGTLVIPDNPNEAKITQAVARYRIPPDLQQFAVPIDTLIPDPMNARLHPEKNLNALRKSLTQYGQQKVIVVRKATRVIIAGNGTVEAAKSLGWTEIAARFTEMNETEAIGYGLADNKTAELARWDFEVMKRLQQIMDGAGHNNIGWTQRELNMLRATGWIPPEESEDQSEELGGKYHIVIDCESEQEQLELLQDLLNRGYTCRALVS